MNDVIKKREKNTQYLVAYTDKKKIFFKTVILHIFYTSSHIPYSFTGPIVSLRLH